MSPTPDHPGNPPGPADRAGAPRRAVVYGLTKRGFFSEVNLLVCNLAYALLEGEDLYIDDELFVAPWSRLFQSRLHRKDDLDPGRYDDVTVAHPKEGEEEWRRRRQWAITACEDGRRVAAPVLGFEGSWRELLFLVSKQIFRPTPDILDVAASEQAALGLEEGDFCAIHVRRGDKTAGRMRNGMLVAEGEAVAFQAYLDVLRASAPGVRRIFVMTDDYREVAAAREAHPELEILTLCRPGEEGYDQQRFRKTPGDQRVDAVRRLMAETVIAARSQAFAGVYLSNVSLMVTALHPRPELCASVDSQSDWRPR